MLSMAMQAADAATDLRTSGSGEVVELLAAEPPAEGETPRPRKFSMLAYTGGAMRLDGFFYPVVIDLDGMVIPSQSLPVFRQHDAERIVGHTTAVDKSAQRLRAAGVISGSGPHVDEIIGNAGNGFPWQSSVGAAGDKLEFVEAGQKGKANGRLFDGPVYIARQSTLREISFVPMGADHKSSASVAASQSGVTSMTFEAWLAARSIDAAALTDTVKAALLAAYKAEQTPAPAPPPAAAPTPAATVGGMDQLLAEARAENDRRRAITEIVARAITENPDFVDTAERISRLAIEGKWDVQRTELEILRASRPAAGSFVIQSKPDVTSEVLEAALCKAGGLKTLEQSFKPEVLEAADRRFRHGVSLGEFVGITARANGWRGDSIRGDLGGALKAAFTPRVDVRATVVGPSTYDISGILGATANKFLKEGFMAVESAWREVTAIRSVNDFKTITSYSLTGDNTYEKVAPGGEIKHGTLGELSYTNQADTYGKMLGIDRRDLINDDLGALTGVSRRLGRGGALKLNDVFWTAFLDNSSFYTSGQGNYDDGASDTLMDLTGIANAHTLFLNLTDPDGKPLGTTPAIILVPPALWPAAWTLLMSTTLNLATSTAASTGTSSPWTGMFKLVKSTYLSNSSFTGYSAAAWYMLADPQDMPVIETCFLNGVEMPTVETADLDFNRLGIALRGYHDFGVTKQEYRGGVKMKGAA